MNKTLIIVGSILGALLMIGLFLLGYKKDDNSATSQQNVGNKQGNQIQTDANQVPVENVQDGNQQTQEDKPEVNDIVVDEAKEVLKTYTNNTLGFNLLIPDIEQINVKEDGNIVYIGTAESLKDVPDKNANPQATKYDLVKNIPWGILIENVADDNELQQVIQNKYGSNCKLGRKETTAQVGLFNVKLDSKNLNTGKDGSCDVYWSYVIKYDQYRGKVAIWDIGLDAAFVINGVAQDDKMADSFRFQ
jgi:hypothetical protein